MIKDYPTPNLDAGLTAIRASDDYPFFLGHADETGAGAGVGFNFNHPLPPGTTYEGWSAALDQVCAKMRELVCDALVVSLGLDTYEKDPVGTFRLTADDYSAMGATLGALHLPTLFVMEGGYDIPTLGDNVVRCLRGFESVHAPPARLA